MKELLIRVSSALYNFSEVTVNGQKQKFVSNKRGSYELNVPADEEVEIQITRRSELVSPMWLFWSLFFFVVSCFGIFDVPYSKRGALSCKVKAAVAGSGSGEIQINSNVKKDGKAVVITSKDCEVEELDNSSNDALVKKRLKTLRIIKLLLWLALIATVIVVVVL